MHVRAIAIASLLAAAAFAGCLGKPDETVQAGGNVEPTPVGQGGATPGARFEVASVEILHIDGTVGPIHEDDRGILVRYVVRQPADAERAETAFVTYVLNGRIVDAPQIKLEPGESKTVERRIESLRGFETISVEVRTGASSGTAQAEILAWPRAGSDSLTLGPLVIRADYGLMEQDRRVLVNLTLDHQGPAQAFSEFRVKMLCALPNGTVRATNSVHVEPPELGNKTGIDVYLDDCGEDMRYGFELKARGDTGDLVGRLLLVPRGWEPSPVP